ncbi:MAG: 4-hydroxy-3-methylbut-2-enyl diphosphate reductase [Nitrospirae bacterium GWD2_57_9]|nr:MAG: 4-hydroxy-3-methylbut-2-enyl diphosphate reductase [Nitrospirae bacterium GWD2_57_9]OGW49780.1 MAG: 4-hydroxy-3-methylbut-2-enyl diphosphate reductase [Nitrospirae bacterium GWC2_57_9]
MKIFLADKAGFCFGVKRAISTAFEAAAGGNVYCLGPLIHNPQEVERLSRAGVRTVEDFAALKSGDYLIIRSHGVPPRVLSQARDKGLNIIDLTCPFVGKAQRDAENLKKEGYQVIVIGEKKHPEVQSIVGYAGDNAVVVEKADDIDHLQFHNRLGIVAQTTQSYGNFSEIVLKLLRISKELKVFNTICNSTKERQDAARVLAGQVDIMLVVGGRNSANTGRLASVCRQEGKPTYHIEVADEMQAEWFKGVEKIGVTAGASTPDWVLESVLKKIQELGGKVDR